MGVSGGLEGVESQLWPQQLDANEGQLYQNGGSISLGSVPIFVHNLGLNNFKLKQNDHHYDKYNPKYNYRFTVFQLREKKQNKAIIEIRDTSQQRCKFEFQCCHVLLDCGRVIKTIWILILSFVK